MRIAFFMQDRGAVYGAERATLELASGLLAGGHADVLLILIEETRTKAADSAFAAEAERRGIPLRTVATSSRLSLRLARTLRRLLEDERVDVLHTIGYKADLHGGWAARFGKHTPVVSAVHGWLDRPDLKERFYGWLNRQALKRFPRVMVLSRYYEQWLARLGIGPLVRIPSGFPADRLVPRDAALGSLPAAEPLVVGMMGRLSEEKNHAMLLRVARTLAAGDAPCRFLIAGDGPDRARIERGVMDMGLGECVELTGYMDSDAFMRRIHVLVMCSKLENMPYAILEAMNWMRPVVATRVGGVPDLVEDGVTGRLVDMDDDAAMADALRDLQQHGERRTDMGQAGRAKLEREFGQADALARHDQLYRELMGTGGRHAHHGR